MQGDILFFKSDGSLASKLVCFFTKGPFCHVAIDLGDGTEIAAHPKGVSSNYIWANGGEMVRFSLHDKIPPACLNEAIDWLKAQRGKPYGWVDILDYALGILGLPLFFFRRDHHDCSTLASLFINRLCLPEHFIENPDLVSPNDLACKLGVL